MSSASRLLAAAPARSTFHVDPDWRPALSLPTGTPEPSLREWLLAPGLLTRHVQRAAAEAFSLRIVDERFEIRSSESIALGSSSPNAWVREIELLSGSDVLVYAHTVVPLSTLAANPWLRRLGKTSLGVALQSVPGVTRSEFEVACLDERHELWQRAMRDDDEPRDLWARRSSFSISGKPLLVAEVFVLGNLTEQRPSSVRLIGGTRS